MVPESDGAITGEICATPAEFAADAPSSAARHMRDSRTSCGEKRAREVVTARDASRVRCAGMFEWAGERVSGGALPGLQAERRRCQVFCAYVAVSEVSQRC